MLYRFDEFSLDVEKRLLFRNGEIVHVPAKVLDTLIVLVEARGNIVTKEAMIQTLWPDTIVEEGGIARNISILRKLLDEHSAVPSIQTLPRRGYRFIRELQEVPRVAHEDEREPIAVPSAIETPAENVELPSTSQKEHIPTARRHTRLAAIVIALLIAIGAIALALLSSPDAHQKAFSATPITTNSYHLPITAAALSPDGRMVVYVEKSEVFVRVLELNETHRLATPERAILTSVNWFPDNTRVLLGGYDRDSATPALWSVSVLGGDPKLLLTDASLPTISANGELIAFHRAPNEVWLMHLNDNEPRLLAVAPERSSFNSTLQFSPDSKELIVHRYVADTGHFIDSHRLADGEVTNLFESRIGIHSFALLPNRELLLVEMLQQDAVGTRLLAVNLEGADPIGSVQTIIEAPGFAMYSLSAAANGERVVLVKDKVQSDVYVADLDNSRTHLIDKRRLTLDDSNDMPSAWFPDGKSLLFHSNREGLFGVYRQDLDSSIAQALIVNSDLNRHAFVVPSRGEFWYLSVASQNSGSAPLPSLVATALDGMTTRTLVARDTEYLAAQCASKTARCVVVEHTDTQNIFHTIEPATGQLEELLRVPKVSGAHFHWALSPDGNTIALVDPIAQKSSIQLLDATGGTAHRSIDLDYAHPLQSIAWDPLGEGFFLTSAISRNRGAILRATWSGEVIILNPDTSPRSWVLPSPDGNRIAFQEWTNNGNAWLLQR